MSKLVLIRPSLEQSGLTIGHIYLRTKYNILYSWKFCQGQLTLHCRTRALYSTYPARCIHCSAPWNVMCTSQSLPTHCHWMYFTHKQKAHGLKSIGMANKNTVFETLMGLAQWFEAHEGSFSPTSTILLNLRVAQISEYGYLAIFVMTTIDRQNWLLYPLRMRAG